MITKLISLYFLFISIVAGLLAQDQSAKQTRLYLEYVRNQDNVQVLEVTLKYRERSYVPLPGQDILIYNIDDASRQLIGTIMTDENGESSFEIENIPLIKDADGFITFESEFVGDENFRNAKTTIVRKEANMDLSFNQQDDTKYIEVFVTEKDGNNDILPAEEVYVVFYVQGSFSLLNIGEEETGTDGRARIEFPVDLPGDLTGDLTIMARIEEHDDYGTISEIGRMNWGTPIEPIVEERRGLGDTDAPLWMVYTLIILLSAVWFHYFYVIFMIIKIKLEEKNIRFQKYLEVEKSSVE